MPRTVRGELILAALLGSMIAVPGSRAETLTRSEALRLAFPAADSTVAHDLVLSREESDEVRRRAGTGLDSRLVTAYTAHHHGRVTAWAVFDTHTVRTLPETCLIVVANDGNVEAVHLVAFHEPPAYVPPKNWLARFTGRALDDALWPDRGIDGITGATLSARAVTAAVRRALAIHGTVGSGESAPTSPRGDELP